ncbi:MAG TPA: cytochrome c oxidase subunit II [Candidatus Sulfotelmatobacter sp.]|nr:cytochrome c oxidase subunit II [Candidatus Sulfotelmatobacter sp.]
MKAFIDWWSKLLGMPPLASSNGQDVDDLIIYVHWLMALLFVGWIIYFFYTVWRFHHKRNPKADYHGVRNHNSNYIEGFVVLVEGLLLCVVAIPLWAKAVDKFPPPSESTVVQVVAQQYAWNFRYPGPDGIFGHQDMRFVSDTNVFGVDPSDTHGLDDIQTVNLLRVPVNKPVVLYVSSKDVIHSLKIISMRVCQDAIPGLRIPLWFTPTQIGRYQINCAQLCGPGHSSMTGGYLIVLSQQDYDKWLQSQVKTTPSSFQ